MNRDELIERVRKANCAFIINDGKEALCKKPCSRCELQARAAVDIILDQVAAAIRALTSKGNAQ